MDKLTNKPNVMESAQSYPYYSDLCKWSIILGFQIGETIAQAWPKQALHDTSYRGWEQTQTNSPPFSKYRNRSDFPFFELPAIFCISPCYGTPFVTKIPPCVRTPASL